MKQVQLYFIDHESNLEEVRVVELCAVIETLTLQVNFKNIDHVFVKKKHLVMQLSLT